MNSCNICGRVFPSHWVEPIRCNHKKPKTKKIKKAITIKTKSHWLSLHEYPTKVDVWNINLANIWYKKWCLSIPSYGCSCKDNWKKYTLKNPPIFTSREDFFNWSVEAHNYVSTNHVKPKKLPITLLEAQGLYKASWIKRKPRAIVTFAAGDHLSVLEVTKPLMQDYADRVGADLITITDNMFPEWPMANKWRLRNYAWNYERTLFLDSDVLIMPEAPDIFEREKAKICFRDESKDYEGREGWNDQDLINLFQSQNIEYKLERFSNGGVILFDYESAQLYKEPELPYPRDWCLDQNWLQYKIESTNTEIGWLDDRWNWAFIRKDFYKGIKDAWFVHLNGTKDIEYRIALAKRIKSGNYEYLPPPKNSHWVPYHDYKTQEIPFEKWPLWANLVWRGKKDSETGIGDTVNRFLKDMKYEDFENWKTFFRIPYENKYDIESFNKKYPYVYIKPESLVEHLVSFEDWTNDTLLLSQIIINNHPNVSGIAGCPRSGMRCASEISLRLGVPLYEASYSGLKYIGGGSRIRSTDIHGKRKNFSGEVVIVDDSTCSGMAANELKKISEMSKLPFYVVYAASPGKDIVTGYAKHLELPHWFDWNILNNGQILKDHNVGIDFDGVLCLDCPIDCDDDGERYVNWMTSVKPVRFPRDYEIPFIITARREAYREITENWLNKYSINYKNLIMFPDSFNARSKTDIGQWKAEQCNRVGVGIFIESDYRQALRIADIRQKTVISIEKP
jgi:uncharacterized HAD superfamily protein